MCGIEFPPSSRKFLLLNRQMTQGLFEHVLQTRVKISSHLEEKEVLTELLEVFYREHLRLSSVGQTYLNETFGLH